MIRSRAIPALVAALSIAALAAILLLQSEAGTGREAQVTLANLETALNGLQSAPFRADRTTGGSPARAGELIEHDKRRVAQALASLRRDSPVPALARVRGPLRANYAALNKIYAIGASGTGYGLRADNLATVAGRAEARVGRALADATHEYDARASTADARATAGSIVTVAVLLAAFLLLYRRSTRARAAAERLADENEALARASSKEARTDALTGLGNRRALLRDVAAELSRPRDGRQLAVALFDLDGFKQYNDNFGHPAGDALLARFGERLGLATAGAGVAYRMGGDEFCVLAWVSADGGEALALTAAEALTEAGEAFQIDCSYGLALVPGEVSTSEEALQLADRRMYADKAGRSSASRQSADVLLTVLSERSPGLREHIRGVATRAALTAEMLGLSAHEASRIELAAELHDVGKAAIPDSILNKPGALDENELQFMRSHTTVGERIVLAAPSLAPLAELVRSSHERFDGKGYPDGLVGEEIPRGASVISVCDAYDAMVGGRPYSDAISVDEALEELRRSAGTQFDPKVVEAFLAVVAEQEAVCAA
jgi:diguanylate cyclase (GGDEF)-like protein